MLESRSHSKSDQNTYDFNDPRNARTPHSNVSEGLLEQQMQLMNEMFRMMSAQHEQLRSRSSNKPDLESETREIPLEVSELHFTLLSLNSRTVAR